MSIGPQASFRLISASLPPNPTTLGNSVPAKKPSGLVHVGSIPGENTCDPLPSAPSSNETPFSDGLLPDEHLIPRQQISVALDTSRLRRRAAVLVLAARYPSFPHPDHCPGWDSPHPCENMSKTCPKHVKTMSGVSDTYLSSPSEPFRLLPMPTFGKKLNLSRLCGRKIGVATHV